VKYKYVKNSVADPDSVGSRPYGSDPVPGLNKGPVVFNFLVHGFSF
jgi:hypothetical protein